MLLGTKGIIIKYLQRELRVRIKSEKDKPSGQITSFVAESVRKDALDAFEARFGGICANPEAFKEELKRIQSKKLHMFVDVSNIMKSAQFEKSGERNFAIRLRVEKLIEIVCNMRHLEHGVVMGSSPDRASHFWKHWEDSNFQVTVLPHVKEDGKLVESAVDDTLQTAMLSDICNVYNPTRTLVMLTGDGNINHGRVTFPQVVERALRNNWAVEVWSWSASTHSVYQRFLDEYPSHFSLHQLDPFRQEITFMDAAHAAAIGGGAAVGASSNAGIVYSPKTPKVAIVPTLKVSGGGRGGGGGRGAGRGGGSGTSGKGASSAAKSGYIPSPPLSTAVSAAIPIAPVLRDTSAGAFKEEIAEVRHRME